MQKREKQHLQSIQVQINRVWNGTVEDTNTSYNDGHQQITVLPPFFMDAPETTFATYNDHASYLGHALHAINGLEARSADRIDLDGAGE